MATKHISLPGVAHSIAVALLQVMDRFSANSATANHGAWHIWQETLAVDSLNNEFLDRLRLVQEAAAKLRMELQEIDDITAHTQGQWIAAVDRLTRAADVSHFQERPENWRSRFTANDASAIETIRVYYDLHKKYLEFDEDVMANIISDLQSAEEAISQSTLDANVKKLFERILAKLVTLLNDIDFYGFEAAWAKNAELFAAVFRFEKELKEAPEDLCDKVAKTAWKTMQFLAVLGGARDGALLITAAANLILGPTPAG